MDIVKYDNDFNLTMNFNKLSQVEQDMFFTITSEFTKKKKTQITLTANDIRQKINFQKSYRPSEVTNFLKSLSVKLSEIPFILENNGEFVVTPIFAKFRVDKLTQEIEIKLNDQFLKYFYDIPLSFTRFELIKFVNIKSKYAKTLFRYLLDLKHYAHERNDGVRIWDVDFEELKKILAFPKSYQTTSVLRNLNKSIDEINKTGYIIDLSYEKVYYAERKGKPIKSLIFSYKIEKSELYSKAKSVFNEPFLVGSEEKIEKEKKYLCPYCKKEVVKRNGPNGPFYGHKYYKDSECKKTWSNLEDLLKNIELVNAEQKKKEVQRKLNESTMKILERQRDEVFQRHDMEREKKKTK